MIRMNFQEKPKIQKYNLKPAQTNFLASLKKSLALSLAFLCHSENSFALSQATDPNPVTEIHGVLCQINDGSYFYDQTLKVEKQKTDFYKIQYFRKLRDSERAEEIYKLGDEHRCGFSNTQIPFFGCSENPQKSKDGHNSYVNMNYVLEASAEPDVKNPVVNQSLVVSGTTELTRSLKDSPLPFITLDGHLHLVFRLKDCRFF